MRRYLLFMSEPSATPPPLPSDFQGDIHQPLLDEPQFTMDDAMAITGVTAGQLKGILDRREVVLQMHNPGTGRRRMATGGEVLRIAVTVVQSAIGFPNRWAYLIADEVCRRAAFLLSGFDVNAGRGKLSIASYPVANGDWGRVSIWSEEPRPELPVAYQVLEVDNLIHEVIAKLKAVANGDPLPPFAGAPVPEPFDYEEFMRLTTTDDQGRKVLVGLTAGETAEYRKLQAKDLADRMQEPDGSGRTKTLITREEEKRLRELHKLIEVARMERLAREHLDRLSPEEQARVRKELGQTPENEG